MSAQDGARGRVVDFDDLDPTLEEPGRRSRVVSFDDLDVDAGGSPSRVVSFDDLDSGSDEGSVDRRPASFADPTADPVDDGVASRPVSFDDLGRGGRTSRGERSPRPDRTARSRADGRRGAARDNAGGPDPDVGGRRAATRVGDAAGGTRSGGGARFDDGARFGVVAGPGESGGGRGAGGLTGDNPTDRVDTSDAGDTVDGGGRGRRGSRRGDGARRSRGGGSQADAPQDDEARAKEICLRLLTDRARTVKELADALRRKEIPDDVANRVLERFDEVGLVDDEAFAGQWVRARHHHKGLGRRAIAAELHRKGVAKDVADEALTEIDAGSEETRARELVDRRLRTMRVDTKENRAGTARRLVGMLARKGYGSGVAYSVVREAIAARGADEDELGGGPVDD